MRSLALTLGAIFLGTTLSAQYISGVTKPDSSTPVVVDKEDPSYRYAQVIDSSEMREILSTLASDEFEGRETGKEGNRKAAYYITNYLRENGLSGGGESGSFTQPVAFTFTSWEDTEMYINDTRYKHLWDYLSFPSKNESKPLIQTDEVIFLGYGIDDEKYSDYKGNDLKGKVILINEGEPMKGDSVTSWITGDTSRSEWTKDIDKKLMVAKKHGVELVLIISEDIKGMLGENRRKLLGGSMELGDMTKENNALANHAYVSTTIAKALIGKKKKKVLKSRKRMMKKGKACDVKLGKHDFKMTQLKKVKVLESNNVMAMIKGSTKPDEFLVVSAHMDHLGKRGDDVYNGADDNGSGSTTIMTVAKAFSAATAQGYRPDRSIVFMWLTGEEKGLLGSAYYSSNPIYPLANTIADINVDMVGRVDKKYEAQGIDDYIYVIGSDRLSTDLHKANEAANQKYTQLILDYTYNDEEDPNRFYYRSDHYNFAKHGIPAIFFFNGTHDDYHQISDTVEKINFPKMQKIGRLIFHLAWDLANRPDRIVVDGLPDSGR